MAYYEYEDTKLYYEEYGEGVPFLLIHGWAIDHRVLVNELEPVFEDIDAGMHSHTHPHTQSQEFSHTANRDQAPTYHSFRRIYIDIPGMGMSAPGHVRNGDDVLDVLEHFMDHIAPGECFYIGGNSFGAHVARGFTARNYDKVLGMMLLVPAVNRHASKPQAGTYYQTDDLFLATLSEQERHDFMLMNANLTRDTYERFENNILPSVKINDNNEFLHKTFRGTYSFDVNKAFEKKKFKKPVLILTAKYDTAVGYQDQLAWLETLPNSSYVCIDGAGHNVCCDQPILFQATVKGWIEQFLI